MTRTIGVGVVAMAFVLASGIAASAAPQRGGGGRMGGGGFSGGHEFGGRGAFARGFDGGARFRGVDGFRGGRRFGGRFFFGAGLYDPFYYPYGLFPFAYYPYSAYAHGSSLTSDVKLKVTPKDAQVFVDGYYAGPANHRLHVAPGGHTITIYRDGYRTLTRSLYAGSGSTATITDRLQALAPGETSAPPVPPQRPTIAPVPPQPPAADPDR